MESLSAGNCYNYQFAMIRKRPQCCSSLFDHLPRVLVQTKSRKQACVTAHLALTLRTTELAKDNAWPIMAILSPMSWTIRIQVPVKEGKGSGAEI